MKRSIIMLLVGAGGLFLTGPCKAAVPDGKGFPTPDAAARALVEAARTNNVPEIIQILGPLGKDIVSTQDPVADRKVRHTFATRAAQRMRLVPCHGRPNEKTLLVGNDDWPLPIPIMEVNGKWYFDTARGKEEILARRIGSNELDAIELSRGYVEAQDDYAEQHRTPAGVPYYAQKVISSPGQQDGLYWPGEPGQNEGPIGSIIAEAIAEGYKKGQPYHGYYFKIITAQGPNTGVPMSYIEDGVMTKGFALIAWPADHGSTGVMTFLVDKSGVVYQKDLGKDTARIAAGYTAYDPDRTWKPVSGNAASRSAR